MKNILLPAIAVFTLINGVCSAQVLPTGFPFPTEKNERTKREKDERVKRDRDGSVINNETKLPPGQAKKVYGGKSAKVYAPGQRKKSANRTYSNLPAQKISVDDRNAQRAVNGRYYYTDANGYIYWKGNDGFYYLDRKYSDSVRNNDDKVRDNDDDDRYDDDDDDRYKKDKKNKHNKGKNKSKGKSRD